MITIDEVVKAYAASIRELDEAQHAYMAASDKETFSRFWRARERYQALTVGLAREMQLGDALEAYRSNLDDALEENP